MDEVLGANNARMLSVKVVGGPTQDAVDAIAKLPNVENACISGSVIKFGFNGDDAAQAELLKDITGAGVKVFSLNEDEALENIYLNMIKESK